MWYNILNMFKSFNFVYGYNTDTKTWEYDGKYYLKNGWWYWKGSKKKAFPVDEWQQKKMKELMEENANVFAHTETITK